MIYILNQLRSSGCISLANINGAAYGGGAEIATACDYRIMSSNTSICFVHAKIGASPVFVPLSIEINSSHFIV